jgi:hypothetical protein
MLNCNAFSISIVLGLAGRRDDAKQCTMINETMTIVKQDLVLIDEIVIRQSLALFSTSLVLFAGALYFKEQCGTVPSSISQCVARQ